MRQLPGVKNAWALSKLGTDVQSEYLKLCAMPLGRMRRPRLVVALTLPAHRTSVSLVRTARHGSVTPGRLTALVAEIRLMAMALAS
jgi:hypothetical protein